MRFRRLSISYVFILSAVSAMALFMFIASSRDRISPEKCRSLGIPVMFIETHMGKFITSKEKYVDAKYEADEFSGKCKVRGHGNTTWKTRELYKKPYLLKLEKPASLYGMNPARKWILAANTSDKTFLRNHYGYWLSKNAWNRSGRTPEAVDVFLFINGKFNGIYSVTEKIEVAPGRLELGPGSFLATVNNRLNKEWNFTTEHGVNFSIRMKDCTDGQYREMQQTVQRTENAIYAGDWKNIIDVPSFVDWYLLNEFIRNKDANFLASCYMTWDGAAGRMHMGPVWDMDLSCGNVGFEDGHNPQGWWVRNRYWYEQLLADEEFRELVRQRWKETRPQVLESLSWLESQGQKYRELVMLNDRVWHNIGKKQWPHAPGWKNRITYESEIRYMEDFLKNRMDWMDENL